MTAATIRGIDMPRGTAVAHRVLKLLSGRLSGKAYPLDGRGRVRVEGEVAQPEAEHRREEGLERVAVREARGAGRGRRRGHGRRAR